MNRSEPPGNPFDESTAALDQELSDLLADEAIHELTPDDQDRLQTLLGSADETLRRQIENHRLSLREAADLIGLSAEVRQESYPMTSDPDGQTESLSELVKRIQKDADQYFGDSHDDLAKPSLGVRPGTIAAIVGWCVAAGLAAMVVGPWLVGDDPVANIAGSPSETSQPSDSTTSDLQPSDPATFIQQHPEAINLDWAAKDQTLLTKDRDFGRLVWDSASQSGLMQLRGLPVNDPDVQQYQLWIIDPMRDDEPIDGGVFDVTNSDEVVVPIVAKLDVVAPVGFAITVEKPGGVVVSDQSRLPLLAMVE